VAANPQAGVTLRPVPPETPALRRSLGLVRATAMVVGIIIGASIFVQPSLITAQVPTAGGIYAVWLVAGALTLAGALVCAELASAFPRSGGVYAFLREAYGPQAGFLWGWAMFWSVHTGIAAAIAMIFARYAAELVPLGDAGQRLTAIGAVLALSAVNYVGVRLGSAVQTALTIAKVGAVAALAVVLLLVGDAGAPAAAAVAGTPLTARGFLLALVAGLFAFGGWHMVAYAAEETREPETTIPRALLVGTLVVTACYIALNAAYLHVLPVERLITSPAVAADAADAVLGSGGRTVTAVLVVVSTLGALGGVVLAGPRLYYAMARDGLLFSALADVHPRYQTPHRAVALQAAWATVLVATNTYGALFRRVVYTEWLFFGLMALSLVWLRRRAEYRPAYRAPLVPVLPVLFALASGAIVVNEVLREPRRSAVGLAIVLSGLPVYWAWRRYAAARRIPA